MKSDNYQKNKKYYEESKEWKESILDLSKNFEKNYLNLFIFPEKVIEGIEDPISFKYFIQKSLKLLSSNEQKELLEKEIEEFKEAKKYFWKIGEISNDLWRELSRFSSEDQVSKNLNHEIHQYDFKIRYYYIDNINEVMNFLESRIKDIKECKESEDCNYDE